MNDLGDRYYYSLGDVSIVLFGSGLTFCGQEVNPEEVQFRSSYMPFDDDETGRGTCHFEFSTIKGLML